MNQQGFDITSGVGAVAKLFAHFDRTKILNPETGEYEYQRYPSLTVRGSKRSVDYSDIDPERTPLNYNLAEEDQPLGQSEFLEKRLGEIYCHKRALQNGVVDWVVTLPDMEQYEGREREFFENAYDELAGKYGRENVISAYIHMDEVQPHMHFVFVPVAPDKKHEQGWKLSRKAVNTCERTVRDKKTGKQVVKRDTREFSKQTHEWLEGRICERMGFEQAGIVLTDEQRDKRTIKENLRGPVEVKQAQERLEGLRRATEAEAEAVADLDRAIEQKELEPAPETLRESVRALWTARNDGEREEGLASEIEGLRSRISAAEGECERLRGRVGELEQGLPGLRGRHRVLRERFDALERRLTAVIEHLGEIPNTVSAWARDLARELGKRVYNPRSLDYVVSQSKAFTSNRGRAPIERDESRGWSR